MPLANATLTNTSPAPVVFTCSNAGGSAATGIVVYNSDTVARNVNMHACIAGEAAAVQNQLFKVNIPAKQSFAPDLGKLMLSNTDVIRANTDEADTTSAVVTTISVMNF